MVRSIPIYVLCSISCASAQSPVYPLIAQNQASAKYAPSVVDAFTGAYNPAVLPFIGDFAAGIYTENRFLSDELKLVSVAAAVKRSHSGISLLLRYFANLDYNESCIGLNYGFSLGKVSLGTIFNYDLLHIRGSPPESYIQYGVASLWQVSEKVFTSFRITNPHFFAGDSKQGYQIATVTQFGVGYAASEEFYVAVESQKEEDKPPQAIFAICYQYAGRFFFNACWSTGTRQPYISAGWQWKKFRIETGCAFHQVLGISPSLTILYMKNERDQ
jgi:hypothetical protein